MTDADVRWVVTLNNGTTAVEHSGDYQVVPGERKPWVRLCEFAAENDLHITSLRLNFRGRTIHMPRSKFDRFGLDEKNIAPLYYALEYKMEAEMGADGAFGDQKHYIDLIALYPQFEVHYIQDLQDGNTSWVSVTQGHNPMAISPRNGS